MAHLRVHLPQQAAAQVVDAVVRVALRRRQRAVAVADEVKVAPADLVPFLQFPVALLLQRPQADVAVKARLPHLHRLL